MGKGLRRSMEESEREPVDGWGAATLTKENEREPVDGWVAATLTKENERELWGVVVLNEGKRNEIVSGCSAETKSNENETLKFTQCHAGSILPRQTRVTTSVPRAVVTWVECHLRLSSYNYS